MLAMFARWIGNAVSGAATPGALDFTKTAQSGLIATLFEDF